MTNARATCDSICWSEGTFLQLMLWYIMTCS